MSFNKELLFLRVGYRGEVQALVIIMKERPVNNAVFSVFPHELPRRSSISVLSSDYIYNKCELNQ